MYINIYFETYFSKYFVCVYIYIYSVLPAEAKRGWAGQYLDGRPPGKTRLLLEEVLVRPAGVTHPVVCVGPNAPV